MCQTALHMPPQYGGAVKHLSYCGAMCTVAAAIWYGGGQAVFIIN